MIKIQEQVWTVTHKDRAPLAYMCQVTKKADGTPDSSTEKMQSTGRSWAGRGKEAFHENTPVSGFVLGDSVSRWTTDNKLFRVHDPRGFEVEVPTGNVAALLKFCNVLEGVIQEKCVWGRDGGSHVLLPVNSEPYIEAKATIEKVATELVKASDLKLGDRVHLMSFGQINKTEYEFMGIVKLSWLRQCSNNQYRSSGWARGACTDLVKSLPLEDEVIQDDKWVSVFKWVSDQYDYKLPRGTPAYLASHYKMTHLEVELSPKVIERVAGEVSEPLTLELLQKGYVYAPERVTSKFTHKFGKSHYEEWRVVGKDSIAGLQFKPEKK